MNINSMIIKINNFNELIVESGFLRDIQEFIKTISQPQNSQNIVLLKDITNKILEQLTLIQESDLPDDLNKLLPKENTNTLKPQDNILILNELLSDTQVNTAQYHERLTKELNNLKTQVLENQQEINNLYNILLPYYEKEREISEKAVISFIFKDINTISSLKNFSKILQRWDRTLFIYHQLVSSEKPEDIELVNIQNGSLDVILNINLDVAINLTEIVKYGLLAFSGYLLYKRRKQQIVEIYFGNKELIKAEKGIEKLLLENMDKTIKSKLLEQHKSLIKKDKAINTESIEVKIKEVAEVLSEHIVKGNDIKLLVDFTDDDNKSKEYHKLLVDTNKASLNVRNNLKKLNPNDTKILIDKYTIKEEQNNT